MKLINNNDTLNEKTTVMKFGKISDVSEILPNQKCVYKNDTSQANKNGQ